MQIGILFLSTFLALALLVVSTAPIITKNPKNIVAIADFPFGFDKKVNGYIVFTAKEGKAVNVHVDLTGLPSEGPFPYHVHVKLVPEDGDCNKVGDHLNPYNASENCVHKDMPYTCQVGDLSGKHGEITGREFETSYDDPYISLNPNSKSYIVGRSVVLHFANNTRFACADIELASKVRLDSLREDYQDYGNKDLEDIETNLDDDHHLNKYYNEYNYPKKESSKYEIYESTTSTIAKPSNKPSTITSRTKGKSKEAKLKKLKNDTALAIKLNKTDFLGKKTNRTSKNLSTTSSIENAADSHFARTEVIATALFGILVGLIL